MNRKRLYLIDATAFCYRAFYAFGGLSTSFGQPTNAVYGFLNILNKILKTDKPEYVAACFDVSRDTFRAKKFAEYKIQRPPMPDGLSSQIPLIKQLIRAYGIPLFEKEGFEADDIIATISSKAKQKGLTTVIVSSDKDILQLVNEETLVLSPYKDEGVIYDKEQVFKRFGVAAEKIPDIIALAGDDIDNIPGVPGIGEKTAVELIKDFGSLTQLLKNTKKIKQDKLRGAILGHLDQINLSRELAVLKKDMDIDFSLEELEIKEPDYRELTRIFKYLEFKKFLRDLPVQEARVEDIKAAVIEDRDLQRLISGQTELTFFGDSAQSLVFSVQDKIFQPCSLGEGLKNILADTRLKKISHDLKKIKLFLAKEDVALEGLGFDTMIAAYLLNPSKPGYSLSELAWDYLGENIEEKNITIQKAVSLILKLRPKLEKELQEKSLFGLFRDLEMPLVKVLARMELNGIKLDLEVLNKLSRDIEKRLIGLVEDIYASSGTQFNINSPKQLSLILFEKLKLPVVKRSKTGPSTDEEVLRKLQDKHALPMLLLEYRQLTKLKNTYVDTLPALVDGHSGRVHTSFNQAATETGRLSSSNPNLQNIPVKTDIGKNLRRAIIAADKKSCLVAFDYSQIELRILAHLSGDSDLIAAFKENKDIHKATASLIYGLEEKEITDSMRELAKRVNFGIVYGLTSYGLSRDLKISLEQAQDFIDAYFARYPRVKDYIQEQILKAEKDGFITTLLGRRRYIPEINNKNQAIRQFAQRQAVNTPIQGSASDLIKLAMIQIDKELADAKLKAKMVMQIHDELVFETEEQDLKKLVGLVRERMENVLALKVPIKVDIKQGKNWLEMEEVK